MKDYLDSIVISGVVISIFLGIVASILIPINAQFGFFISVCGTIITLLIDINAKLNKSIEIYESSNKKLLEIIGDHQSIVSSHDSEIFDKVIDNFCDRFRTNANNLARGFMNVGGDSSSVRDLFDIGEEAIKQAKKKVLAVEAGTTPSKWIEKRNFLHYHELIVSAVKSKNIHFERIWIVERPQDREEHHEVWRRHRRDGLKHIYFVYENELPNNLRNPDYLDFAIVDDEILIKSSIIRSSSQRQYAGGQVSIVKEDLENARKQFSTLKRYTHEYK